MNELEALELSIKLWQDIADNNYISKSDSKYYDEVQDMMASCPLCEYYLVKDGQVTGNCGGCPLANRRSLDSSDFPCLDESGLFRQWCFPVHPTYRKAKAYEILGAIKSHSKKVGK